MGQNAFGNMIGVKSPEEAAAILRNNGSLSAQRQSTVEKLFGSRGVGGGFDAEPLQDYLGAEDEAAQDDPWAEHYRNVGGAQSEAAIYNLPEVEEARNDERSFQFEKAVAPARIQGQYAVKAAESKAQAQLDNIQQMGQVGLQPGQRMSISGVGSINAPTQPRRQAAPASVTNRLLDAQKQAQPSGWRNMLGMGASDAATSNLTNVIGEISRAEGIPTQMIQDALSVAQSSPAASVEDLFAQVDGDDLSPQEREQFISIFSRLR